MKIHNHMKCIKIHHVYLDVLSHVLDESRQDRPGIEARSADLLGGAIESGIGKSARILG
jgi:hypothetical protein